MRISWCLVPALAMLSCVASGPREDEPTREPSPAPTVSPTPAAPARRESAATPPPAVAAPAVVVADSTLPTHRRIVSEKATSGLVAFVDAMPKGGLAWVGPLAGNGGRDVLVYVPPGARNDRDFQLVVHFHGTHSQRVQAKAPGLPKKVWVGWDRLQQTIDAVGELQSKGEKNVALVYPLSAGKRREPGKTGWYNKEYDRMWMDSAPSDPSSRPSGPEYTDSFDTMHDEVIAILTEELGAHPSKLRGKAIAEGHSAGGLPLFHIARNRTEHVGEYLFLDASFQSWADGCWKEVQAAKSGALVSIVVTINGIADPFGKPDPWCIEWERDAALWKEHRRTCTAATHEPPGSERTCGELEVIAKEWEEDYREWCEAMKNDMRDVPGVFVLRTKIPHGKQPRHFVGGLELPADRYTE
ncbi:MAG TPA: hypothetical protein VFG69_05960 [Nannocystaceae bacterium]|nr:hypothetical protein [Nannocystaceae bacterium]